MAVTMSVIDFLIRDSNTDIRYNNAAQLVAAKIDRSYICHNIAGVTGKEVQAAAVEYIKASYVAPNAAHPVYTVAKAVNYRSVPLNSSTACEVIVSFEFNFSAIPTTYTVETNGGLQSVNTNAKYNSSNQIEPIFLSYYPDWTDPETNTTAVGTAVKRPATVPTLRPISNIVITRSITDAVADSLESGMDSYMGYVNSTTFRGRAARIVLCTGINVSRIPYEGRAIGRLEFGVRPETWDDYARITSTQYGTPSNIWLAKTGGYAANGIEKVPTFPKTDLNALVTLLNT